MSKGRSEPPDSGDRASTIETSSRRRRGRPSGDSAARLRRVRDCLGLSQREMAAELDVAHGAVGLWESGARPVPGPVLRLMSLYEQDLGLPSVSVGSEPSPLDALSVSRTSRNAKLLRTAAGVAARATVLAFRRMFVDRERARVLSARTHATIAARMAERLGEMKGLAMKMGQSAGYLDFALPEEARAALASLCARSRPMAPSTVAEIFLGELGKSPRQLFAEWSPRPFAAASIGQVHRARLKSGELVAVKVQYPGIVEAIEADLKNLLLAERASALIFRGLDAGVFSAELRERFLEECDYLQEAANQRELRGLWSGCEGVFIPRVFEELTTSRILVTELATGDDFETFAARASQPEKDRASQIIYRFAYESIFRHGLFNADPNPGNYLFGGGGVTFLDFGCVKRFPADHLALWRAVVRAILERDFSRAAQLWIDSGYIPDPDGFDFAFHHRLSLSLHQPWLVERPFTFTHAFIERTWRMSWPENRNRFRLTTPKHWVFTYRLNWGLYAVLAKLGACGNWRSTMLDLLYREGEARPNPYSDSELALLADLPA
jgi:predicted unusual protein kinase regulating ubiquinone biosynthesis (AarF/ABC1/UbiB family)/DNA-binding transcriptional regulator YiaG